MGASQEGPSADMTSGQRDRVQASEPSHRDELPGQLLEPIRKEVESVESVVIPCVAPESGRGASCGSRNIERRRIVVA
jgi:hypothetical protein